MFWTEFYQTFPAFNQLCFMNVNLTFPMDMKILNSLFNLEFVCSLYSVVFYDLWNKYQIVI